MCCVSVRTRFKMLAAFVVELFAVILQKHQAPAVDASQGRAQVMRDGVAESFQFFIRGFELGGLLPQILVQPSDLLFCMLSKRDIP